MMFSPSSLNLFQQCPRCFWLEKNKGIRRPRGIFPSLPGGMDLVIKKYFDGYRAKNELPPEVRDRVSGGLFADIGLLERWRNWRTSNLQYRDGAVVLRGALDDCLVEDNCYIPLDYKTRGSALIEDPRKYYQTQMDCYCLMLNASGFATKNLAYLLYYWPEEVKEDGVVKFTVEPIKIETDIEAAKKVVRNATLLLASAMPEPALGCEYCTFIVKRSHA